MKKTTKTVANPIVDVIRAELENILRSEPLSVLTLHRIIQTAQAAKALLIATQTHAAIPPVGAAQGLNVLSQTSAYPDILPGMMDGVSMTVGPSLSYSSPTENFGAKALREIIAALPALVSKQNRKPADLVNALAEARKQGLDDIARSIERELLGQAREEPTSKTNGVKTTNGNKPLLNGKAAH